MVALLSIGYGLNLLDRQIINILGEPIKRDLQLADWQLGALSGISFALLYSVAALPIARLADRSNRARIIGIAILVWSFFTAASAVAANFIQLLLLRIGVGVGEAGGGPPSQSLIADSFPPERRAGALAVFSLGAPVGASIGLIGGGILAGMFGWRWTMVCAGAPGLVLGALVLLTVRDPARQVVADRPTPTPRSALSVLLSSRSFVLFVVGTSMLSFVNYGAMAFAGSFYLRTHLDGLAEIGKSFGLEPLGVVGVGLGLLGASAGTIGALVGGRLGDRFGSRDARALALISSFGAVLATAGYFGMFTASTAAVSLSMFGVSSFFGSLWFGPGTLAMQRLAGAESKATAMAVALLVNSALGLSLGPLVIGAASDLFAPQLGAAEGLRAGILLGLTAGLVSGLLLWIASRSIRADLERIEGTQP